MSINGTFRYQNLSLHNCLYSVVNDTFMKSQLSRVNRLYTHDIFWRRDNSSWPMDTVNTDHTEHLSWHFTTNESVTFFEPGSGSPNSVAPDDCLLMLPRDKCYQWVCDFYPVTSAICSLCVTSWQVLPVSLWQGSHVVYDVTSWQVLSVRVSL